MTTLTPTAKQAARASRDRRIAADFYALRKANPDAPVMAILRTIASNGSYGLRPEGLKRVLTAAGHIKPRKRS